MSGKQEINRKMSGDDESINKKQVRDSNRRVGPILSR